MKSSKNESPQQVYDALLQATHRSDRRGNLAKVHEICRIQSEGSMDFSIGTIGKLLEVAGGLKARVLYNAASSDYRTLIDAWARNVQRAHGESAVPDGVRVAASWIDRISDPVLRTLAAGLRIERDKLSAELNLLRAQTTFNISVLASPLHNG